MTSLPLRTTPAAEAARPAAIEVTALEHRYGAREALRGVELSIRTGEIFALLGPNGGGKTTLFKVLSTLVPVQRGRVTVLGHDLARSRNAVRYRLGVVFQSPGLDPKLTVRENLVHHGHLHGLRGRDLHARAAGLLERFDVADRSGDLVETLSGGLARRTELARALLHGPELLLLDEPSTGLDPGARRDFFALLRELRDRDGVTVVLTTHHIEEADRADRVAVLDRGSIVALGTPDALKRNVGGDVVAVEAEDPEALRHAVLDRFGIEARVVSGTLRIERPRGHELVRDLVEAFGREIRSVSFGRPTLEDVFVHVTGREFAAGEGESR
jgi:ABC-2 type transport system ATP-binding protein